MFLRNSSTLTQTEVIIRRLLSVIWYQHPHIFRDIGYLRSNKLKFSNVFIVYSVAALLIWYTFTKNINININIINNITDLNLMILKESSFIEQLNLSYISMQTTDTSHSNKYFTDITTSLSEKVSSHISMTYCHINLFLHLAIGKN